jgi:hypothetical protein
MIPTDDNATRASFVLHSVKRYAFSDRHDAWLDTNDDHHCIQLFTHELIRHCKGYPSF